MGDYTSIQCYDAVNRCSIDQINTRDLSKNPDFLKKCQGKPIKCCNLDLVNHLYIPINPSKSQVPIHVKKNSVGQWEVCPETAYTECSQTSDFGLCASRKCNDLGYLEPDNYYQVCKALNKSVPDCSDRTCNQVVNLIQKNTSHENNQKIIKPVVSMCLPDSAFEEKGFTIGNLFKVFPKDDGFFIKATVIVAVILLLIMLINFSLGPRQKGMAFSGSDLYSQYLGKFL